MSTLNLKINRNIIPAVCVLIPVVTFALGRYSAPTPPRDEICKKEINDAKIAEAAVAQLESDLDLQKGLLTKCEDDCDKRVRGRIDDKDAERKAAVVEAKKKQKDRYVEFKCRQCVRKGLCQ